MPSPNRPYIASRVFNDAKLLESLNKIIHPKVREDFKNWQQCQTAPYCLYEAAILFEHGGEAACDHTILVTAPKEIRIQRLLNRDHSDHREIEARMAAQWSDDKKMALADFVIENLLLNETEKKVSELHDKLLQMATA